MKIVCLNVKLSQKFQTLVKKEKDVNNDSTEQEDKVLNSQYKNEDFEDSEPNKRMDTNNIISDPFRCFDSGNLKSESLI